MLLVNQMVVAYLTHISSCEVGQITKNRLQLANECVALFDCTMSHYNKVFSQPHLSMQQKFLNCPTCWCNKVFPNHLLCPWKWNWCLYGPSPHILLANWISFGIRVTHFAWIAHRLESSKILTAYASHASCRHSKASHWNLIWVPWTVTSWATSQMSLANGSFLINNSVLLWYLRICSRACVPLLVFFIICTTFISCRPTVTAILQFYVGS